MKKSPIKQYQSKGHLKPILGTLADESRLRRQAWIKNGCNAFDSKKPMSQPLSFWTEQDILNYIRLTELEIASVYGEIVCTDKHDQITMCGNEIPQGCKLKCTGYQRTGCVYCAFGFHSEKKGLTRFQILAKTRPQQYEYCMRGGQWIDNPDYDPFYDGKPDEQGWVRWNPKKIFVPHGGLGLKTVFDMVNEIYGKDFYRYE